MNNDQKSEGKKTGDDAGRAIHDDRSSIDLVSPKAPHRKLNPRDKGFVIVIGLILAACSVGIVTLGVIVDGPRGGLSAFEAALIAIIVGASFSFIDRMGFAAPIEDRLLKLLNEIEAGNEKLDETVDKTQDYIRYVNLKKKFGVLDVEGELAQPTSGHMEIARDSHEFALRLFEKAEPGSLIRYMNTFLEDEPLYYDAIGDAIKRGVHVRLLMINPHRESAAFLNRYNDCLRYLYPYESSADIVTKIRSKLRVLENITFLRDALVVEGKHPGLFEMRYYENSLNFPMLLLSETTEEGKIPYVAYTGFYGQASSEAMPYIKWREGRFNANKRFVDIFDGKWDRCEDSRLKTDQELKQQGANDGGA